MPSCIFAAIWRGTVQPWLHCLCTTNSISDAKVSPPWQSNRGCFVFALLSLPEQKIRNSDAPATKGWLLILQGAPGQIFGKTVRPWESYNEPCIDTHYSTKHWLSFFFFRFDNKSTIGLPSSTADFFADLNENDQAKVGNFFTAWRQIAIWWEVCDIRVIICWSIACFSY